MERLGLAHHGRARWRGQEVVVKVLRPGVERLVAADLRAADRLVALANAAGGPDNISCVVAHLIPR
jgi:predicted unusual protein kinase regulating ubiquinone biosynthesis (AarF/ABC1/UbiB family)